MKKNYRCLFEFLFLFSFLAIIIKGYFLLQRPFVDNDEGIYLTSFLLVDKGYKLYREVFFSQLPGFFLLVYPGFVSFGKSLLAARLTIFLWSIIGFLGIIWLLKELKKTYLSLIIILAIWLIPKYFNQATILQSDALVPTFSVLTLASLMRFVNKERIIWLVLSLIFFLIGFLTKLDMTVGLPALVILFPYIKKIKFKHWAVSLFGLREIINNTLGLRLQAASYYPVSPQIFWQYFVEEKSLVILTALFFLQLVINFFYKRISLSSLVLVLWLVSTAIFIIFFRPIFPHHLSLLVVPLVLSTVFLIDGFFKLERKYWLVCLITVVLLLVQIKTIKKYQNGLTKQEDSLVQLIKAQTDKKDFIVTDEAKFYPLSQRLPPPELVDTSFVRILSGNLNKKNFSLVVKRYKLKLIILWNGRLARLTNNGDDLTDLGYKKLTFYGKNKAVYFFTSYSQE